MRVGWIVSWSAVEGPMVDFTGNTKGPLPAQTTLVLDSATAQRAAAARQGVVLLFACDGVARDVPIVMGLLQTRAVLDVDLAVAPKTILSDGKRLEIKAEQEISLVCGEARIVLRANGRVRIEGVQVETFAGGTNRIKGGSVQIN